MGTIAKKLNYLGDTKTAIKNAIVAKNVEVSDTDTFRSYADKIGQIQTGGGEPTTRFGASVDTWIGDVDENGVLNQTTWTGALNFARVKKISGNSLQFKFHNCPGITSVDFSSLQSISNYAIQNTFYRCSGITNVDFSSLQSIDSNGMYNAFYGCSRLTRVDLSSLQSVGDRGMFYAFYQCSSLTSVDLSSLQSVGSNGMQYAFHSCNSLTTMSFPSLTNVASNSFGTSSYNTPFNYCTALTEIHFRADMQATIEAMTGYSSKFGATNATIYFDL